MIAIFIVEPVEFEKAGLGPVNTVFGDALLAKKVMR
jgi:hypothetical protein